MTIGLADYFGGRREKHGTECSPDIQRNASRLVPVLNKLLDMAARFQIVLLANEDPASDFCGTLLNSGWRPPSINACTPGASATSLHMTGEAADLHDPGHVLADWLLTPEGQYSLQDLGLWMEDPGWTRGSNPPASCWVHVQSRPPKSERRVFVP